MTVLIVVVAGFAAIAAIATNISGQNNHTALGRQVLIVVSGSMSPVIHTGDLIIDDTVTGQQARYLHVGQVISFRAAPGSTDVITHRIIGRRITRGAVNYITKGDANNSPDAVLRPASDVIGVFRISIRGGGYIVNALHHPAVAGMLLASVLLWLIAMALWRKAGGDVPGERH